MPTNFRASGRPTRTEANKAFDQRRGTAASRGYDSRWAKSARGHRRRSPLCRYCEVGAFAEPRVQAANLVDHFYPHRGDSTAFWDTRFWVSSCDDCHNGPKQQLERRGHAALAALAPLLGLPPLEG